jgi:hypothetical protein
MAYKDEKWFEGLLGQYSKGRPKPFKKSLARAIELGQESPESAAESIRAFGSARDWNPRRTEKIARKLASKTPTSIETERYGYLDPVVESTYANIYGRLPTEQEKQLSIDLAGAYRINPNDPGAFGAFLTDLALASPEGRAKFKTEEDLAWERQWGPMLTDASGNLQRGLLPYSQQNVSSLISTMLG